MTKPESEFIETKVNFLAPVNGGAGNVEGHQIIHIYNMDGGEIKEGAKVAGTINEAPPTNNCREDFKEALEGSVVKDEKYNGELVNFEFEFLRKVINCQDIIVNLSIVFGEAIENNLPYKDKKVGVKFGIKYGKLYLTFVTGENMPLNKREHPKRLDFCEMRVSPGQVPVWEFKPQNGQEILKGYDRQIALGLAILKNKVCEVEGVFKLGILPNDIVITEISELWNREEANRKIIETAKRTIIKNYLAPQLSEYVSKITWKYDSTTKA